MFRQLLNLILLVSFGALFGCTHEPVTPAPFPTMDKEKIRSTVKTNIGEIKKCYEDGLKGDPNVQGKFVIQWTIGRSGKVLEAKIKSSSLKSDEVESCAVAKLKSWTFPEPPSNEVVVVSYPFVFQTEE